VSIRLNRETFVRRAILLALVALVPLGRATAQAGVGEGEGDSLGASPQRRALEDAVRGRVEQVVQQQVGLTDDQMGQLRGVNERYAAQRRDLVRQEREIRLSLRDEIQQGQQANQQHVDEMMGKLLSIQSQRVDLVRSEQKDLAKFMTPVQRVKYAAIQERLRQRLQQMRRQRLEGAGKPAPRLRPPPKQRAP